MEIDCPSSCSYLKASRSYELDKPVLDREIIARAQKYGNDFINQYHPVLDAITLAILEERLSTPWLVDADVIETYKALTATMKTLSSGIYYESLPDQPVRISLFRRVKALLDQLMQPEPNAVGRILKVSEAIEVLEFLTLAGQMNTTDRPRSRRYLDWITEMTGRSPQTPQSSGLILP